MKNKVRKIVYLVLLTTISISCNDSIDLDPQGTISSDVVFKDPSFAEAFLNNIYNGIPNGFNRGWYMLASATDDAENSYEWPPANTRFNTANITSINSPFNFIWANSYANIRELNNFIENYDGIEGADQLKNKLKGEAHFLRAYYYTILLRTFGEVPIITVVQVLDTDDLLVSRNTKEEVLNFIVDEYSTAASFFENASETSSTRGSWDAAMALKGRVLLYEGKFPESSLASKSVLDNTSRFLDADYSSVFINDDASEVIFDQQFKDPDKTHSGDLFNFPWGPSVAIAGWGATNPTQDLIDEYEMQSTGLLTSDAESGYDIDNPYTGRDPRFYASIINDNSSFNDIDFFFRPGGNYAQGSKTGYQMKKFLVEEAGSHSRSSDQHWIFLRLAEVYLNYAEALIESNTDLDLAVDAINKVRNRSNMPAISIASQNELRRIVRHERRIELAFEEHRFWDIRRWGIAGDPSVLEVRSVDMDANGKIIGTGSKLLETRNWIDANLLFPIPQDEIDKNPNLTQNPGY